MSAKPIDEFLNECNVWLEKIAAAKAREEAALRAIDDAQLEKQALFRGLARFGGKFLSRTGKGINRFGNKMQRWGNAAPKNTSLQNPLAKQVAAAHRSGAAAPKMVRGANGKYSLQQPKAPSAAPAKASTPAPTKANAPAAGKNGGGAAAVDDAAKTTPAPAEKAVVNPLDRLKDTVRVSKSKNGVKYYSAGTGKQLTDKQVQNMLSQAQNKFGLSADDFTSQLQARGANAAFAKSVNAFREGTGRSALFNNKMQRLAPANAPVKAPVKSPTTTSTAAPTKQAPAQTTSTPSNTGNTAAPKSNTGNTAAPKSNTTNSTPANASNPVSAPTTATSGAANAADDVAKGATNAADDAAVAAAAPSMWQKAKPWALAGGGGLFAGHLIWGGNQQQQVDPVHMQNLHTAGLA